jgi:hypothetical protein
VTLGRLSRVAVLLLLARCGGGSSPPAVTTPHGVDLVIDHDVLAASIDSAWESRQDGVLVATLSTVEFAPEDCELQPDEQLISTPGVRRLLRFSTQVWNRGDTDLHIGDPLAPVAPLLTTHFQFNTCHGHTHFEASWVEYRLLDSGGALAGFGHKQGFCIEEVYDSTGAFVRGQPGRYHCEDMGIGAGYADIYPAYVPGQWVDVTGLPAGDYTLELHVNPTGDPRFGEETPTLANNVTSVRVRIAP